MGLDHAPPAGDPCRRRTPVLGVGGPPAYVPGLFVELEPQQLPVEPVHLVGLCPRARRFQQTSGRVQAPQGVVGGEAVVVGPGVADRLQLRDVAAVIAGELLREDRVPLVPHDLQQELRVGGVDRPGPARAPGVGPLHAGRPVVAELRPALALHERGQTLAQQRHRLADPFIVGECHGPYFYPKRATVAPVRAPQSVAVSP